MTLKRGKENNMAEENTNMQAQPELKYSDDDVNSIVNKRYAKWKSETDKAVEQAVANAIAELEEKHRVANMNEKEKADHERKQMQDELAMLKAEKARSTMMKEARQMFSENGINNIPEEVIGVLVADSVEGTRAVVNKFSGWAKQWHEDELKASLAGNAPAKGSVSARTKEEILAIKDRSQRLKAIEENFDLFK